MAWVWKPTKGLFALHLFCWDRLLVKKMMLPKWIQSGRSSVQVKGQLFIRARGDLQPSRDQACWKCHGCPCGLSCLPGCCRASAVGVCYLLLLPGSLTQALAGMQKRVRVRLEVGALLLRLWGVWSSLPPSWDVGLGGPCCCVPNPVSSWAP